MNDIQAALIAEAKARVQRANPQLSDAAWQAWLQDVAKHGGRLVLQLDGCRADYSPLRDA